MSKEAYLIISVVLAIVIGVVIYDYQVRKQGNDLIKRIATMGTLKKIAKSPITLMAFIWGWIWSKED